MLRITIPKTELYDERKKEFVYVKEQTISLEHSLVSISKWEAKWHKPFLTNENKTTEETVDYIRCMTLTQNVDPNVYYCLQPNIIDQIMDYINDPMSATIINDRKNNNRSKKVITSELIYFWMITLNIPYEYRKWHINRLLTLIRVVEIEGRPQEKLSEREVLAEYTALNERRKKELNTRG